MKSTIKIITVGNDTLYMNMYVKTSATLHNDAGYPFMMFRTENLNNGYNYITMDIENNWHLRLYNKLHPDNKIKHSLSVIMGYVFENSHNNKRPELIGSVFRAKIPSLENEFEGKIFSAAPFQFKHMYLNVTDN